MPERVWTREQIEDALVAAGWPPISPWWSVAFERIDKERPRYIVGEVGRRGGKSSTIAGRDVLYQLLGGRHHIPPGDVGYFIIISADKGQAQERLDTVDKALNALGIAHRKTATEITLEDSNLGVICVAAKKNAVVSYTCIGFICDEMAVWLDKDEGANPAIDIVNALSPTMATVPNAYGWYVSAPWSDEGLHAEMVDRGDIEGTIVVRAITTEANPTLTDAEIRRLEPDEQTRLCAYYLKRLATTETSFFPKVFVDAATQRGMTLPSGARRVAGLDPAFTKNSTAMVVLEGNEQIVKLIASEERIPGAQPLKPSECLSEMAAIARMHGAEIMASDIHYRETVREVLEEIEMPLGDFPSAPDEIADAYVRFRILLSDGRVDLTRAPPRLIQQLKDTKQKPGDGGTLKIINKSDGNAHGDNVSALIAASWALDQPPPPSKDSWGGKRRFARGPEENREVLRTYRTA